MKKLIQYLQQSHVLKWTIDILATLATFLFKGLEILFFFAGAVWFSSVIQDFFNIGPSRPKPAELQNIILDESKLVRCRKIDRSQPSCTLISECEDGVDRCVGMFEILRRPARLGDFLPTEE